MIIMIWGLAACGGHASSIACSCAEKGAQLPHLYIYIYIQVQVASTYRFVQVHIYIYIYIYISICATSQDGCLTVDFRDFIVFLLSRDPGTLKSDIVSKKHPRLICSDLRFSNWKFEDWNYGNRPYRRRRRTRDPRAGSGEWVDGTPNLPTNIVPTNIAWLKLSGKSTMLVGGLGVVDSFQDGVRKNGVVAEVPRLPVVDVRGKMLDTIYGVCGKMCALKSLY